MSSLLNRLSCTALRRSTAKCPLTSLVTSLSTCSSSNNTTGGSNKSYERGAPPHKVLHQTIGDCLEEASTRFTSRGHSALVSCKEGGLRWSYAELFSRAQAVAKGLLALGLPPLARIGVFAPNCSEWVVAQFAASLAGLILVNINPAYQLVELEHALNKVQVSALIMTPGFKSSNYVDMLGKLAPELVSGSSRISSATSSALPHLKHIFLIGKPDDLRGMPKGLLHFDDLYKLGSSNDRDLTDRRKGANCHDPVNIQFTSGTTGRPKAAVLTHFNILNNGLQVGHTLKYTEQDRVAITVPLYHCFGIVMGNLACLTHGSTMVYPDASFNAAATLDAVQSEGITSLYGVPTMFVACVAEQERLARKVATLRTGITGGAICPPELMRKIVDVLGINSMTNCYGMTETSPVTFQLAMDASFEKRISTVGKVHPGVECKVVAPIKDNSSAGADSMPEMEIVDRGDIGEVWTRGYVVMKGYWEDDNATKKAIDSDGWMQTGDLGILDGEGYLKIVGRNKDMIIRGGENIYPSEIENFLITHEDVEEAHVFGVPDEYYGERMIAHIRLRADRGDGSAVSSKGSRIRTKEDVEAFCKGKIAHFKVPSEVCFVRDFPLTVTGKVMKYKMRDDYIAKQKRESKV